MMDTENNNEINPVTTINKNESIKSNEDNNEDEFEILVEKYEKEYKRSSKSQFLYKKRAGTSGLGGQLYETKLLSLILLRLLKDNNVNEFHLGTNIDGIGAFDDIVFRYKTNESEKPKIVFVQAKHRDDPNKNKLNIEEILQEKYLDSYIKIKNKFLSNNKDNIFDGTFKEVDCSFVFYTPAVDNFTTKKLIFDTNTDYMITGNASNVFQFVYKEDDIERFLKIILFSRSKLLAKSFMRFVLKGSYHNMMTDGLIKTYHIFLAHNVLDISNTTSTVLNAKFSSSFLDSDDLLLSHMRDVIYNELMANTKSTINVEVLAKSLTFNLPHNFGNLNFHINGTVEKKKRRIDYLCLKLRQLFDLNVETKVIRVTGDMVGTTEILQHKDLEIYRLGGLVGHLLIEDTETGLLKFNNNEKPMNEHATELYEQIKCICSNIKDLTEYRFDFDCYEFPKLTLQNTLRDRNFIKDFLGKLIFYTKQAQEDEVEQILKDEINQYCNISQNENHSLYRIKGEAVFLKVHHEIQKWWKQPTQAPYLSRSCNFYEDTKDIIFNSSLLSTFNYFCIKNIMNIDIKFCKSVINSLLPDKILKSNNILNIVTGNILMTSIKLREYLVQITKLQTVFLDLEFIVSEDCFEATLTEIKNSNIQLLIILCKNYELSDKLMVLIKPTKELTIIVTEWTMNLQVIKTNSNQNILQFVDDKITFVDLTTESQNVLLQNNTVIYQGFEIPLGKLLHKTRHHLIKMGVLHTVINRENIIIGKTLKTFKYNEFKDYYVEQNILRCIKINLNASTNRDFMIITDQFEDTLPAENQDIIIISDNNQKFDSFCKKYSSHNIHWFGKSERNSVWRKSYGKLYRLLQHVERCTDNVSPYLRKPLTLLDIEERIVILSGEPGMGKSTLMTYLSHQTKESNPELWVIQINLINYKTLFSNWQENNIKINLKEVMKFLFAASSVQMDDKVNGMTSSIFDCDHYFDINITENGALFVTVIEDNIPSMSLLEAEIFCDCYNNGQIVILFDGFDEITPDYTKEAIMMMEVLSVSNVCRLWITSRSYNVLNELQNSLGTFSFSLMPLAIKEQKCLLEKIWAIKLGEKVNTRLVYYVNRFYETLSLAINDKDNKFSSIPLHLYMISEIYQDFFKDYYDPYIPRLSDKYTQDLKDVSNLTTFYERFVEIKFYKIRFGEKKPFICTKDPDMKKMIERERKDFIENHKMLAAYSIFDKNVHGLFNEDEIVKIFKIMESIKVGEEKTGIVDRVVNNIPKFIHLTYAEYFATEYLCDKLKSKNCSAAVWIYLFDTIFTTIVNVRKFFECKLEKDKQLFELSLIKSHKFEVFNVLLKQIDSIDTSLCITLKEYSERIAIFILNSMRVVTTKENLSDFITYVVKRCKFACAFCFAVENRRKIIVRHIMDIVGEIDKTKVIHLFKCGDVPAFNALGMAVNYCRYYVNELNMLDVLLENIDGETLLQLFTMPCNMGLRAANALHVLVLNYDTISRIKKYILKMNKKQRMRLFSAADADSNLPAHYAGQHGDENFFNELKELLNTDQYKRICMTRNPIGHTPIRNLKKNAPHWHRLQALINDVNSNSEFAYPL